MNGDEERSGSGQRGELAGAIVVRATRTLSAPSARIEFCLDLEARRRDSGPRRRRRGGLLRPLGRVAELAVKALGKRALGNWDFRHMVAEGILEPASGRYMIDFGSFAQLHVDATSYSGRSGHRVDTLEPWSPIAKGEPLWLLRILAGVTDAAAEGVESVHGTSCQKFAARVDMARASAATPTGLRAPAVERFEDLFALPVLVWTDHEHVRRVQFDVDEVQKLTLDLWDFGQSIDELDWSRLPTFKSPREAAYLTGDGLRWRQRLLRPRARR